jgi:hypothetical protein
MVGMLSAFLPVFSQDKLSTGLNIGHNSSIFVGNNIPGKGLEYVSGALIGGFIRFSINDIFSIQSEINFDSKGSRINTIDNLYEYVYLDYLEIPVLLESKFRKDKILQPFILAGPALGINTRASGSRGYLNDIKKLEADLIFGAGIGIRKLSLQIRFNRALTRFDNSPQKIDLRNSTLSVLAGFNFLNKK